MATTDYALRELPRPQVIAHEVRRERRGWIGWLTTTDHKKIGTMNRKIIVVPCMVNSWL